MAWAKAAAAVVGVLACLSAVPAQALDKKTLERMRKEREAQGIYNFVKLYPEQGEIEFTYGGPERRRMSLAQFEAFVRERMADHTLAFRDGGHGHQIEYYAPDGRLALWYPGNRVPVPGRWFTKVSMEPYNLFGDRAGVLVCFVYPSDSYNPITQQTGGEPECDSAYAFLARIRGKRAGDVFQLLDGDLPSVLDNRKPPAWPDGEPLLAKIAPHG